MPKLRKTNKTINKGVSFGPLFKEEAEAAICISAKARVWYFF